MRFFNTSGPVLAGRPLPRAVPIERRADGKADELEAVKREQRALRTERRAALERNTFARVFAKAASQVTITVGEVMGAAEGGG